MQRPMHIAPDVIAEWLEDDSPNPVLATPGASLNSCNDICLDAAPPHEHQHFAQDSSGVAHTSHLNGIADLNHYMDPLTPVKAV